MAFLLLCQSVVLMAIPLCSCLPEQSTWTLSMSSYNSFSSVSKSMIAGSTVHAKVYCSGGEKVKIAWALVFSPCIEEFCFANVSGVFSENKVVTTVSDHISYTSNQEIVECQDHLPHMLKASSEILDFRFSKKDYLQSDKPISAERRKLPDTSVEGQLGSTWSNGAYQLMIYTTCVTAGCKFNLDVHVHMADPNGHFLSAVDYPFLPVNGVLASMYCIIGVIWLVLCIRYHADLLRIQFWIAVLIFLGLWEHLMLFAIYAQLDRTGNVLPSSVYFSALISCVKRTLARLFILIVCLGYGVTKPRLGQIWFRRFLATGMVYFVLVTVEGMCKVSHSQFATSQLTLINSLLLTCLDFGMLWWIFIYLTRTLQETRARNNVVKHKLYTHFGYTLLIMSTISIFFMTWSAFTFSWRSCITSWKVIWLTETFWQFSFWLLLTIIVWLWRPSAGNREYAYSLLDPDSVTEPDQGDSNEITIYDSLTPEDNKLSQLHPKISDYEENRTKVGDSSKTATTPQSSEHGRIPATIIERIGAEAALGPNSITTTWKTE